MLPAKVLNRRAAIEKPKLEIGRYWSTLNAAHQHIARTARSLIRISQVSGITEDKIRRCEKSIENLKNPIFLDPP